MHWVQELTWWTDKEIFLLHILQNYLQIFIREILPTHLMLQKVFGLHLE